jgi:hypothetical protein
VPKKPYIECQKSTLLGKNGTGAKKAVHAMGAACLADELYVGDAATASKSAQTVYVL